LASAALSNIGSVEPLALADDDPSLGPGKGTRACSSAVGLIGDARAAPALVVAALLAINALLDLVATLDVLVSIFLALLFFLARCCYRCSDKIVDYNGRTGTDFKIISVAVAVLYVERTSTLSTSVTLC
jgi:hypothetical protein